MRMASLSSGSSGNAIYLGTEETHVLVDAGISNRRIENGLKEAVRPNPLSPSNRTVIKRTTQP